LLRPAASAPAAASVPESPPAAPSASREQLIQAEHKLERQGLDLRLDPRGLVITLPQAILFESGEDRINPSALSIISQIAAVLHDGGNKVELAGYADTIPIHNKRFKNNWELSAARSLGLLTLLVSRYGIDESRLSVSSYGSQDPKSSNDTADGRAENRRVEILILDEPDQPAVVK
jgi:chemotaxis protein MotB